MNLAIDIGNSLLKAAVFEDGQVVETFKTAEADEKFFEQIFAAYPAIDQAILSSLREDNSLIDKVVKPRVRRFMTYNANVPVPVKNLYSTPQTLGIDRLAAAVGAHCTYPAANVLIVDFGTAITIDVVTKEGEFLGGNISPGAGTRFRALHDYTSRLPLRTLSDDVMLVGDSSYTAIESGVINGIVFEIEGYIARLSEQYEDMKIIFTGGDSNFFAKRLKNTIFATYDLVVSGLNRILEYNAE